MKLKIDFFSRCMMLFIFALGVSNFAIAQRTVTGTITDSDGGDPLIGANILVVGTASGTTTDIDGTYSLNVPKGSTQLEISYTGYKSETITLGASNVVDVKLTTGELLDEVVVIGYGSTKRSDVTGAISSVSAKDFNVGVVTNPDQLIQGKVAGVQVTNNSGAPGGAATVRIRGISSIRSDSDPLYVVDGVPLDGRTATPGLDGTAFGSLPGINPLTFLNTADIASISILKDASAAAIYGSRAANGVIIITTKKGVPGKPSIDVNIGYGSSEILNKYDVLDGDGYRDALRQYNAAATPGEEPFLADDGSLLGDEGGNVDAMDAILRNGITQNYNIAFNGGTENGTYRFSLGYLDQEGIVKETGLEKYVATLRGNFKFTDSERLTFDYNVIASHLKFQTAPISTDAGFTGNLIGQALQWNPTSPLVDATSSTGYNILSGSTTINPAAMLAAYDDRSNTTNLFASVAPSFELFDGLTYKLNYSIFHGTGERRVSLQRFINVQNVEDRGWAGLANQKLTTQYLSHTLNYSTELAGNNLDILLGFDYMKFENRFNFIEAYDFNDFGIDYQNFLQGSSTGSRDIRSGNDPVSELQSFFGRVNYNIDDKLILTGTLRRDGSSKFGPENSYGLFPSFAAAYNLGEEDFVPAVFDVLKLRAGWGVIGNQAFPSGAAQETYTITSGGGFVRTGASNPGLQWEETTTFNIGVDYAIADYKLVGSIEYFNKSTTDLLFNTALAAPAPDISIWTNLQGEVVNSGVEIGLKAILVEKGEMSWDLGANIAFIDNEIKNFGRIEEVGGLFGQGITGSTAQRFVDGQPLYAWYTREHLGLNAEGQSEFTGGTAETKRYLGSPIPSTILGIYSTFRYGNFDFNIAFNGAYGQTIYNNTRNTVTPIGNLGTRNVDASLVGNATLEATSNAIKASDRYIESGDYLKLTNATIGYNFGDIGSVKGLRVTFSGQNLLTITDYSGFDPEINTVNENENGVKSLGIEYTPYPTARTFFFGIGCKF